MTRVLQGGWLFFLLSTTRKKKSDQMRVLVVGMLLVALTEAAATDGNQGLYNLDDNCTRSLAELLLRGQTRPSQLVNLGNDVAAATLTGVVNVLTQLRAALLTGQNMADDQKKQCSTPYTLVGEDCLLLAMGVQLGWEASRQYCNGLGGDLATFPDANTYAKYLDFINLVKSTNHGVWIGGMDVAVEGMWTWVTGELMPRGPPFWGSTNNYIAEPSGGRGENCAILHFPDKFYVHDISCNHKAVPLCMKNN